MEVKENKRRFERVNLDDYFSEVQHLVGADVRIGNNAFKIFDMSFRGAAIVNNNTVAMVVGQDVDLQLNLPGNVVVVIAAKVIWSSQRAFGLEFKPLTSHARYALEAFLSDKLIGNSLRQIDKSLIVGTENFDYWFNGPNDTNIYIWQHGQNLKRAIMELEEVIVGYEDKRFTLYQTSSESAGQWLRTDEAPSRGHLGRLVHLLAQASDPQGILRPLLREICQLLAGLSSTK